MARLLVDRGAQLETKDAVRCAAPPLRCLAETLAAQEGDTALRDASCGGRSDVVRLLLDRVALVNARNEDGRTAVECAAIANHTETLRLLLSLGGDVDARQTSHGWTALHFAAEYNLTSVLRILISHGAAVEAKSSVRTARFFARPISCAGRCTKFEQTALARAAASGSTAAVTVLIDEGAEVSAVDIREARLIAPPSPSPRHR